MSPDTEGNCASLANANFEGDKQAEEAYTLANILFGKHVGRKEP